jgi:1,4-dihydroxy-2-naphthoyl-CoA hydrolase
MIRPEYTLDQLNKLSSGNMGEHLGMEFTELGNDYICGKMPVDHRTKQPMGLLHGGASVSLAETLGSVGSMCMIDTALFFCVGLEINANHIKSAREGYVYGKASLVHGGKNTHIWDIRIVNENKELVCISRLTVAIIPKKA